MFALIQKQTKLAKDDKHVVEHNFLSYTCMRPKTIPVAIFRAQEPKAPVTYCDHALSGVRRPSVVRRPLDYLHFRLLLQNHLMDFDETWYG